jgi:hypothetical protein
MVLTLAPDTINKMYNVFQSDLDCITVCCGRKWVGMAVWPEGCGIRGAYIDKKDRQYVDSTSRIADQFMLPTWVMKEYESQYAESWPHAQPQRIVFFDILFRDRPLEYRHTCYQAGAEAQIVESDQLHNDA